MKTIKNFITEKLQISRNKTRIGGLDISPAMFEREFMIDYLSDKSLENMFYDEYNHKKLQYYEIHNSSEITGFLEFNINYKDVLIIVSDKTYSNLTGIQNIKGNEVEDIPENIQRKLKLYSEFTNAQVFYIVGFSAFVKDKEEYFKTIWNNTEFQNLLKYMAKILNETI